MAGVRNVSKTSRTKKNNGGKYTKNKMKNSSKPKISESSSSDEEASIDDGDDEEIDDGDDEEIDEDEAFNSDDEQKYGALFGKKAGEENSDIDDYGNDDDDEADDGDGGQYMLDLLDKLDPATRKDDDSKKRVGSSSSVPLASIPESEFSSSVVTPAKLTLDGLMAGISDTKGFASLRRAVRDVADSTSDLISTAIGKHPNSSVTTVSETSKHKQKILRTPLAPAPRVVSERAERTVNYDERSRDISLWTDAVKVNREAETLDFRRGGGNNSSNVQATMTRDTMVSKFAPTTNFEREIAHALEQAGAANERKMAELERSRLLGDEDDDDDLGSNIITPEEYEQRRGELAKIRALMFYEEQKRHHINKIKSKKYRKIRKRQRERDQQSEDAAAATEDPEFARHMREKEEMERMKERMTLAHKNTSKWAKRVLRRGGKIDMDTRRALSEQIRRGDDLRSKMKTTGVIGDDDDDDDDENILREARSVLAETEQDSDRTNEETDKRKGLFQLSFMQRAREKEVERAKEDAKQLLMELEANAMTEEDDEYSKHGDNDEIDGETTPSKAKKPKIASAKETERILPKGQLVASTLQFGNTNSLAVNGEIDIDFGTATKTEHSQESVRKETQNSKRRRNKPKSNDDDHVATIPRLNVAPNDETYNENSKVDKNDSTNHTTEEPDLLTNKDETPPPTASKTDQKNNVGETNPWLAALENDSGGDFSKNCLKDATAQLKSTEKPNRKGKEKTIKGGNSARSQNKPSPNKKAQRSEDVAPKPNDDGDEGSEGDNAEGDDAALGTIASLSQEELVRRAFAAPKEAEVDEEFEKEKNAIRERDDPTLKKESEDGDRHVSGWGSWAGKGAPKPRPPKKLPKKLQPPEKKLGKRQRQDDGKRRVIINERRVKRTSAKYQIAEIPYPFTTREQYDRAMAGALGSEWNVSHAVKDMTRPEVLTRSGKIIRPITIKAKSKKSKRAPAKF